MQAPRVEGADAVVVEACAVDGPDGRNGGRHLLLVAGQRLQLVERHRLEIEFAREGVELLPRADHQRGVLVAREGCVFLVGIGHGGAVRRGAVGGEERTVDVVVAVADLLHAGPGRADALLQDAVAELQLAVFAVDAVHLRGVEKRGEDEVGQRHDDESRDDAAQQPVRAQAEGDAGRLRGLGRPLRPRRGLCIRRIRFLFHAPNFFQGVWCKIRLKYVNLQPGNSNAENIKIVYDGIE